MCLVSDGGRRTKGGKRKECGEGSETYARVPCSFCQSIRRDLGRLARRHLEGCIESDLLCCLYSSLACRDGNDLGVKSGVNALVDTRANQEYHDFLVSWRVAKIPGGIWVLCGELFQDHAI